MTTKGILTPNRQFIFTEDSTLNAYVMMKIIKIDHIRFHSHLSYNIVNMEPVSVLVENFHFQQTSFC